MSAAVAALMDQIEVLGDEVERLRDTLREIRDFDTSSYYDVDTEQGYYQAWCEAGEMARRALVK